MRLIVDEDALDVPFHFLRYSRRAMLCSPVREALLRAQKRSITAIRG